MHIHILGYLKECKHRLIYIHAYIHTYVYTYIHTPQTDLVTDEGQSTSAVEKEVVEYIKECKKRSKLLATVPHTEFLK